MARLIDADALKEFPIRIDHYDKEHGNKDFVLGIETVLEYAEHLPTVDAVPVRHGRWEEWWPGISLIMTGEEMLHMCSSCGAKYADIEGYKHCPNCGLHMDLEVKDDN